MKMKAHSIIFVILLLVLQVSTDYPDNMGMYWGFSIGDNFYFTMNYTGEYDDIINSEGRIRVDNFDQPFNISDIWLDFYLANDDITVYRYYDGHYWVMTDAFFVFSLLYYHVYPDGVVVCGGGLLTPFAFPLGNFSCLASMILKLYYPDNVVFLESEYYWGFEITSNRFYNNTSIYPNWNVTMQAHFDFSKDDGFVAHYHGLTTYVDTGDIFQEVSLDRNGLEPQIMTPITYISETTPDSSFSNTTPVTNFSNMTSDFPFSNTTPGSLYYEPMVQGMYMTAAIVWAIAIIFMIFDYKKRITPIN